MEQKKFIILALALVVVLVLAGAGYKLSLIHICPAPYGQAPLQLP